MSSIRFYNRYTNQIEEEEIYGEAYLRWTYENLIGRLTLNAIVKRSLFSKWYGWRMSRPSSVRLITPFIDKYKLNTGDFEKPVSQFSSFNDFFYRKLKPNARPVCEAKDQLAFPADGRHLAIGSLGAEQSVYAKGQKFDLYQLVADEKLASRFAGGSLLVSRLCPVDYHRFHSPARGRIVDQRMINGSLFSVSPVALVKNLSYLWENKRVLTLIETEKFGYVAFIAIGATCVGSIVMTKGKGEALDRGAELGYFAFGGSCIITLFERDGVRFTEDLLRESGLSRETYSHFGDTAGTAI